VLEASEEDCFVMSLVENLARRHHSPIELVSVRCANEGTPLPRSRRRRTSAMNTSVQSRTCWSMGRTDFWPASSED
jgi:hypothetical protein